MKELLLAFAVLIAAPFCIGLLPARFMPGEETWFSTLRPEKGKSVCPAAVYAAGLLTELAVFQLVAVPVIILEAWGFPTIVTIYSVLLVILSLAGVAAGLPVLKGFAADLGTLPAWKGKISIETCLYCLLAVILVGFQMYMAYTCAFFDGDDAYYVVQSVIADETDVLYRILPYTGLTTEVDIRHSLASLPIWEAYLARVTGTHATVMAHSILPLVIIPATYMLYFRIGMKLFKGSSRKTAIFLIIVSLLQIFGNTSIYTNATFFLMRTWQGKSMLCNLVLLAEIWILLNLAEGAGGKRTGRENARTGAAPAEVPAAQKKAGLAGWWFLLVINNIAAAMMTTMGAFLAGLFIAVAGLVWAVREKRPKILLPLAASCIPCLLYLALYVFYAG